MEQTTPHHPPLFPPSVALRAWDDAFVPLAPGDRAASSEGARALAASAPHRHGFLCWTMRPEEALWSGEGTGFGAALFADGTALLGESPDGVSLVAAPMVFAWRGVAGEGARSWLAGMLGDSRRARLESAGYEARDVARWRVAAGWNVSWRALLAGHKAIAPWKPCTAKMTERDAAHLHDLVDALVGWAGSGGGMLLGATLEDGRLAGPTLALDAADPTTRLRVAQGFTQEAKRLWGPHWVWRCVAQHRGGHQAVLASSSEASRSGHRRLELAARFPLAHAALHPAA